MLIAYVAVNVLPEKCIEFEQTVFALQSEFRETKGCLNYNIYKDTEQDTTYFLMSEWQNQEMLESHLQSNIFDVLLGAIHNLCEPPEVNYRISSLLDNSQPTDTLDTGNSLTRNIKNGGKINIHL